MDHISSSIWVERLKREARAKKDWEAKFMTEDEQAQERQKEEAAQQAFTSSAHGGMRKKVSERDAMEMRLSNLREQAQAAHEATEATASEGASSKPSTAYSLAAERIRDQVTASRPRSHRITGERSFNAMLGDIGPGLWVSVNPAYTHLTPSMLKSSAQRTHTFEPEKGWAASVDKKHHLKQDAFMAHADKCLQLGEKPFVSGGMRATPKNG